MDIAKKDVLVLKLIIDVHTCYRFKFLFRTIL